MSIALLRVALGALLPILLLAPTTASAQNAAPPGVLWETTSQMSMEGMPMAMPVQTMKVCAPAQWTEPPGAQGQQGCTNSQFEQNELTVTWTSTCSAPMEMAGNGEIVFADDTFQSYTGKVEYAADEGLVMINLTGKVIGTCDKPQ
jgi:Protein of unknown function (DUF3617)